MKREWMEEILQRLALKNGSTPKAVREEMEAYLEALGRGEEGEEIDRRVLQQWQGKTPDIEEFIACLAQEMEWEQKKEEELRAFLDGET